VTLGTFGAWREHARKDQRRWRNTRVSPWLLRLTDILAVGAGLLEVALALR
jgi:hypothetical protein